MSTLNCHYRCSKKNFYDYEKKWAAQELQQITQNDLLSNGGISSRTLKARKIFTNVFESHPNSYLPKPLSNRIPVEIIKKRTLDAPELQDDIYSHYSDTNSNRETTLTLPNPHGQQTIGFYNKNNEIQILNNPIGLPCNLTHVNYLMNNTLLFANNLNHPTLPNSVLLYDINKENTISIHQTASPRINAIKKICNNTLLIGSNQKIFKLDVRENKISTITEKNPLFLSLETIDNKPTFLTGNSESIITYRDMRQYGKPISVWKKPNKSSVTSLLQSSSNPSIFYAGRGNKDGTISIYDIHKEEPVKVLPTDAQALKILCLDEVSKLYVSSHGYANPITEEQPKIYQGNKLIFWKEEKTNSLSFNGSYFFEEEGSRPLGLSGYRERIVTLFGQQPDAERQEQVQIFDITNKKFTDKENIHPQIKKKRSKKTVFGIR